MVEQNRQVVESLIEINLSSGLRKKTIEFVARVGEVEGISQLILVKYMTGHFRFYAVWRSEEDKVYEKVQEIWEGIFKKAEISLQGDPIVIQPTEEEFQGNAFREHLRHVQLVILWPESGKIQ